MPNNMQYVTESNAYIRSINHCINQCIDNTLRLTMDMQLTMVHIIVFIIAIYHKIGICNDYYINNYIIHCSNRCVDQCIKINLNFCAGHCTNHLVTHNNVFRYGIHVGNHIAQIRKTCKQHMTCCDEPKMIIFGTQCSSEIIISQFGATIAKMIPFDVQFSLEIIHTKRGEFLIQNRAV